MLVQKVFGKGNALIPIEAKFVAVWKKFKSYAESDMGCTNELDIRECVNGCSSFVGFLIERKPVQPPHMPLPHSASQSK